MSLRRNDGKAVAVTDDLHLLGGDTLVLSGAAEALALAEEKLLAG
jgi:CPA2 family monovalent cation:H+ antiporter-2